MNEFDTVEMLAFRLKLLARRSQRSVLISAGREDTKRQVLPAIEQLAKLGVSIFATSGTSRFLSSHGIANQEVYKITEKREPNIKSLLEGNRFDLVVNILTGSADYDESSDSKLIRLLAIENGIPLITDADVAVTTIGRMVQEPQQTIEQQRQAEEAQPWNLKSKFLRLVLDRGGYACYHAHFDKAYLISMENLRLGQVDMQKKWDLYKYLKENYTFDDLVERISRGVEAMIAQGVTYCRTMVDADSTVKILPAEAALEVKRRYAGKIRFEIGVQPLQGVLDKESRKYFVSACEMLDFVGGLPSKDRPTPEKHLDFILSLGRDLNKPVDVHVDQENNPFESETELLAHKTIEHRMQGRVAGIHAISLAAKYPTEQDRIIGKLRDAGVSVVICPSAALSMKALEVTSPIHNSIAPLSKLLDAGVRVYMGVDNVYDLFMPVVDGDMWFECRMLMEACRFYDIETVARLACDKSGFTSN